jgi:hypothetical protein
MKMAILTKAISLKIPMSFFIEIESILKFIGKDPK